MELFDKIIKEVQGIIGKHHEVSIVGGAVRDTLIDKEFKDIDVCIIPKAKSPNSFLGVPNIVDLVLHEVLTYNLETVVCGFESHYGGGDPIPENTDFAQRLHGCLKLKLFGYDVDLLIQKEAQTTKEVVQGYDHLANAVYYKEGQYFKADFPSTDTLFNLEREVRPCRVDKMNNMMLKYGSRILQYREELEYEAV